MTGHQLADAIEAIFAQFAPGEYRRDDNDIIEVSTGDKIDCDLFDKIDDDIAIDLMKRIQTIQKYIKEYNEQASPLCVRTVLELVDDAGLLHRTGGRINAPRAREIAMGWLGLTYLPPSAYYLPGVDRYLCALDSGADVTMDMLGKKRKYNKW